VDVIDDAYEESENRKALGRFSEPHRIQPEVEKELRAMIALWPTPAAVLAPTHGDWQPRNWLVDDGVVGVIDFGRAALRPAMSDFGRLAAQEFQAHPDCEAAFIDGYGADPREAQAWHRHRIREAVSTAAWAYQVGDEAFEAQGHRILADAFSDVRGIL
jgi:thiamine kinase-like enzyme